MTGSDYKYDVGVSFLQQDEPLALELSDLLNRNLGVFVYSEQQEQLAGTDGLESFRAAFRDESRLNVVLYRDGWGETPWTTVEQLAIQDRCLKEPEGWDSLFFVKVDPDSTIPKWVPDSRIRFNLPDYGIEQLAGAIKTRTRELGTAFKRQNALSRARTLEHQTAFRAARENLFRSHGGVRAVYAEVQALFDEVNRLVNEINEHTTTNILIGYTDNTCKLTDGHVSLRLHWQARYANDINDSPLRVTEINGRLILPQERRIAMREPGVYREHKFDPDVSRNMEWYWKDNNRRAYSSTELADHCVQILLELIDKADSGELRVHDPY